jgi:hypothetical protein
MVQKTGAKVFAPLFKPAAVLLLKTALIGIVTSVLAYLFLLLFPAIPESKREFVAVVFFLLPVLAGIVVILNMLFRGYLHIKETLRAAQKPESRN